MTFVSEPCTQTGAGGTCVPYPPLSYSFLRLENCGPSSWAWPGGAIHSTSVGPQAFIPGKSTPGHSCLGGTGVWVGQERNPMGRCTWTRSWRKEGSFLIDEFGKGISERGNRQHKSPEVQGCIVHSGKGRWFAGAVTKAHGACMGGGCVDRSCAFSMSIPELKLELLSLVCGKSLKDSLCSLFFYYKKFYHHIINI